MAKSSNLPAKRFKAGDRTATKIRLFFDSDAGSPDRDHHAYVDIAQCLSMLNQRAYRQGLYYYVAGVTVHNTADSRVIFSTAPDTWHTKNAWSRGWRAWMRQQEEAMEMTGMVQAKYADYKVALDDDHVALHVAALIDHGTDSSISDEDNTQIQPTNNLLPAGYDKLDADTGNASSQVLSIGEGEWCVSQYVAPDHAEGQSPPVNPDSYMAHLVGGHDGTDVGSAEQVISSVGLIKSYVNTRMVADTTGSPDLYGTDDLELDPIVALFDYGDTHEDILKDIDDFNDMPPYHNDEPFGVRDDDLYQVGQCKTQASGGGSIVGIPGFCVPFGLLRIDVDSSDDSSVEVILDIVPGPYHGVYAERVI